MARQCRIAGLQSLREYSWPGNVRELDHAAERADGDQLDQLLINLIRNAALTANRPELASSA